MTDTIRPAARKAIEAFTDASALMDPMRLRIWDSERLTVTQLRLLGWVAERDGVSNAELAELLYVTRPSVSALLERLERGGFIRREISPSDRRGICIRLEERGRTAVSHLQAEGQRFMARLMDALSDADLEEMAQALERFVEAGRARRARDLEEEQHAPADN